MNKTLIAICAAGTIILTVLATQINKTNIQNKPINLQTKIIAEFVDRNQNGLYDGYRIFERTGTNKQYLASQPYFSSDEIRTISFESPFGGTLRGEFDKEFLANVFNHFKYPPVNKIEFLK